MITTKIDKLKVSLFKGFKNTEVNFSPGLNLLVGSNNSGKSSILQAAYLSFYFLKLTEGINEIDKKKGTKDRDKLKGVTVKSVPMPFHEDYYISEGLKRRSRREGSTEIECHLKGGLSFKETLTFPGSNLLAISSDVHGRYGSEDYRKRIKNVLKKDNYLPLLIPTFSGVAAKEEEKLASVVRYYISTGRSSEVLRNQLKVIAEKKEKFKELNSYLENSLGVRINFSETKDINLSSYYEDGEYNNLDISSAGSGFQQILQIIVYIVTSNSDIILIDEPDAHLHCRLQGVLYDILSEMAANGKQIIVSTHSQEFIRRAIRNSDRLIIVDKTIPEQKALEDYGDGIKLLYDEGIIDEKEITRGSNLKIVDIEDEDGGEGFAVVKEWLHQLDINEPKYRIVSAGGEDIIGYVRSANKIDNMKLKALVIRDSDSLPEECLDKIEKKCSNKNLSLVFWRRHEIENYLIDADIIVKALKLKGAASATKKSIQNIINDCVNENKNRLVDSLEDSLFGKYSKYHRDITPNYGNIHQEAPKRTREIRDNLSYPYDLLPGKELLKAIKQKISSKYGANINENEIAKAFELKDIPKELKDAVKFISDEA